MSLLGIDIGTTGCKAAAFGAEGALLAEAYRQHPPAVARDGRVEMDSRAVFSRVKQAVREVAERTAGDPITALSVSSMGEAATPVSAGREILGSCILMNDPRGEEYVERLGRAIPQERFYEINPNILSAAYTLPKLCWLRDHEPARYARADWFLLWADLAAFLLGGEAVTNYTLANRTLLFDLRAEGWSDRLIDLAGLDGGKLAPCVPSGTVAGEVTPRLAEELGLPRGVKIVIGGHDQCCNALGAGLVGAGRAVCGIGTYECIEPVYDRVPSDTAFLLAGGFNVEHHVLAGLYVSFLYSQGGSLVRWFRRTFAPEARAPAGGGSVYDLLAREAPDGPTGLLVLPHFDVTGPPYFTDRSAGVILGLRTSTTRGEIYKAVLEGETFYFVRSVRALGEIGIDTSQLVATGGGARSDLWLQVKADILGVPFVRPRITEASTLGAAMLAGLATGVYASGDEAVERFVRLERVFEPDPARHAVYRERHERYCEMYPLLKDLLVRNAERKGNAR